MYCTAQFQKIGKPDNLNLCNQEYQRAKSEDTNKTVAVVYKLGDVMHALI